MRKKYQSYRILSARTVSATGPWFGKFVVLILAPDGSRSKRMVLLD